MDMRISFCISTGSAMNTSGSTSGGMSNALLVFEFEDVVFVVVRSSTIIVDGLLVFEFEAPEDVAFVVFLEGVFLEEVFLEEVFLEEVFLEEAFLEEAFLEEVFLEEAFLEEAFLEETFLEEAFLEEEVVEEVEITSLDEVLFFFLLSRKCWHSKSPPSRLANICEGLAWIQTNVHSDMPSHPKAHRHTYTHTHPLCKINKTLFQ